MSMEFTDNQSMGSGGLATGLAMGSMMNRRDDESRGSYIWAVIIFAIIFIIAIIALAMMFKDRGRDHISGNTDVASLLTPLIAAKSMDCNNGNGYAELYEKMDNNEVKAGIAGVKSEVGALGLYLTKNASDYEMKNLEQFGEIKATLGMQSQALSTLLQENNNKNIINGVIQQLTMCSPCYGKC